MENSCFASLLLLLALFCSGCASLGPEYEEPELSWVENWNPDLYGVRGYGDANSVGTEFPLWWEVFNDPVLNELVVLARKENPGLRIAGLRILESRAFLGVAGSGRYPQIQQITGGINYVNTQQLSGEGEEGNTSLGTYNAGYGLGWELDFWGKFRRGIESADSAFFASVENQRNAQILLTASVVDLYYAHRLTVLRIAIAKQNAATQKRSFEITEHLFESGQDSELDLQQAKTQYLATLSTIPGLEADLIRTRNALCGLLGLPPGPIPQLDEDSESDLPTVDPVLMSGLPAQLLMQRPDVRAAAWQVAAQSAQIGIAKADFYPSIALGGSLGFSGDTPDESPDKITFAIGPSLSWNVFDFGRIQNNVRVQDARLQQAIVNYQNTVLQAAREIDDAAIQVVKSREEQDPLSESVTAAERSLELATRLYREGYADFQRILDAQRAVAAQTERELVNRGLHLSAFINFYTALGGGWLNLPLEEMIHEEDRIAMEERIDWDGLLDETIGEAPAHISTDSQDTQK